MYYTRTLAVITVSGNAQPCSLTCLESIRDEILQEKQLGYEFSNHCCAVQNLAVLSRKQTFSSLRIWCLH
jgi:hypothetical protein